jgi:polyhydroxybutyrate depolymerase
MFMADDYTKIDLSRVYIWGFGEGGRLAAEVACEESPRRFAAVGAVGRFDPVTGPRCADDMPHDWITVEDWNEDTTKALWTFSKEFPADTQTT